LGCGSSISSATWGAFAAGFTEWSLCSSALNVESMQPEYWGDLRFHPVIIRPTSTAPDLTLVPHRGPDTMEIMEALTQPRQRLDDWMRQGTQLFGKLVEENEALQQRVRSAEAHSLQVTEMVHELEREITRLRGELDDFKIQRGQVVEAVQSWVGEMGRLTNELLARTKRH